jgi:type III secretion protein R
MSRARRYAAVLGLSLLVWSTPALAQVEEAAVGASAFEWVAILGAVALLPFVLVMVTSFVKVSVVLAILRNAIGAQGVPPGPVIIGLAIILSIYIMAPVGLSMYDEAQVALDEVDQALPPDEDPSQFERVSAAALAAAGPLTAFLERHAHQKDRDLFVEMSPHRDAAGGALDDDDLMVLVPAFVLSELKEAFQIGFLIFIPFIVIDMVVANILLSLGMHMLSPTTVSMPFKLLLFVLVDGWYLIVRGLVESYQMTGV